VFVTGMVLAAGASSRLGSPKQLLEYKGTTVLGATLDVARSCGFDQILVTVGGASAEVRDRIDFRYCEVVENEQFETGCSSSIGAALGVVDIRADGIILMLGDQPEVSTRTVTALIENAGAFPLGVCRYRDGVGHPFWFERQVFEDLSALHGDKAVWKLLESGRYPVCQVEVPGDIPLDVDTWEDYEALLAQAGRGSKG
jgi:molybdenum cofactor cytidylyltransferase